ncbi:hypothetical protein [Flaviaesturariibacter terrae]
MAFIDTYRFRARLPKADLLHFVAQVPVGQYVFVVPPGPDLFGLFASPEVLEFFCNECRVEELEIIDDAAWAGLRGRSDCRIWGDPALLEL